MLAISPVLAVAALSLAQGFADPPASCRPHVWWDWMNGNVTKDGIVADIRSISENGFGGFTVIDIGGGVPRGDVTFGSEAWYDCLELAVGEARRLNLEVALENCSGWSSSGGPWISPSNAMKKVVWSETKVSGPRRFRGVLPPPESKHGFYADIAVVACSAEAEGVVLKAGDEGLLEWDVPAGDWTLYRFGYAANGRNNIAASSAGRGLECDKFDRKALDLHFDAFVGKAVERLKAKGLFAPETGTGLTTVLVDSYEVGDQDWTHGFERVFLERRKFDPLPLLPLLAGRSAVNGVRDKEFLAAVRQTCEELFAENYIGALAERCHALGLKFQWEPYGREMPGKNRRHKRELQGLCDLPTGEFWATDESEGHWNRIREIVRQARRDGRTIIGAEAFTAWPKQDRWSLYPFDLKINGDRAFSAGVNRLYLHSYVHQPWPDAIKPGMTMDQFGTHFDRNSTWWPLAREWVRYLTRCQYLLQSGVPLQDGAEDRPHRRYADGTEGFFIAVTNRTATTATFVFPFAGRRPELWDPSTGGISLARRWSCDGKRTEVSLSLDPCGSVFVMFPPRSTLEAPLESRPEVVDERAVDGPWTLVLGDKEKRMEALADWSRSTDEDIRYFSGTAEYRKRLEEISCKCGERVILDLGEVAGLVEVCVNGRSFPALWKPPYSVDITEALDGDAADLRVRVANLWANRLIGDERLPADVTWRGPHVREIPDWVKSGGASGHGRRTFSVFRHWKAEDDPLPSGLLGPVTVRRTREPDTATYARDEWERYAGRLRDAGKVDVRFVVGGDWGEDGFRLFRHGGGPITITGGKRGVIYGAYELLERFGGIVFCTSWYTYVPANGRLEIPDDVDIVERPSFIRREAGWEDAFWGHPDFAVRLRLNGNRAHIPETMGGMPVRYGKGYMSHTFEKLLPVRKYAKAHPEWFAEIEGVRRTANTQPCLTNPEVLEMVTSNLFAAIEANPDANLFAVSQYDNINYCRCAKCRAVDEEEGSSSGTMMRFVNAVAERVERRWPNLVIQYPAYQYTQDPPKLTKPRGNVLVDLAAIESDFALPMAESRASRSRKMRELVAAWGKLTKWFYVWYYTTNFRYCMHPMPTVRNIAADTRFFRDNGVTQLHMQGCWTHAAFAELKQWIIAKTSWNADAEAEALIDTFCRAYYGDAAPFVKEILADEEQAIRSLENPMLSIFAFDEPRKFSDELLARTLRRWREAEAAVKDDDWRLHHVRMGELATVATVMDRAADKAKWIWATEHPESIEAPRKDFGDLYRWMKQARAESARSAAELHFSELPAREAWFLEKWERAYRFRRPKSGSPVGTANADDFCIQQGANNHVYARIVNDGLTASGRTLKVLTDKNGAVAKLSFANVAYDRDSAYRVRVRVKVVRADGAKRGEAFYASLNRDYKPVREAFIDVADVSDDYAWYDLGSIRLTDDLEFGFGCGRYAKGGGRLAVKHVLLDKLELKKEGSK